MQILPTGVDAAPTKRTSSLYTALGWSYIALSAVCSCLYIVLLDPATLNDIWWSNYSSTHHQALLIDTFNSILPTHPAGPMDLLSPRLAFAKQYVTYATTTEIYPTYPRRLVMTELTSIEYAVKNLRTLGPQDSIWIGTQYCWVDLARHFEVAHTQARQNRCRDLYAANGAVYLETILRNIVWDDFMSYFGDSDGLFGVAVLNWLEQVPEGQRWIAATAMARQSTTEADEVAYWAANSITDFTLQWQNDYITGISEVFVLENAMGLRQQIVLNNVRTVECTWTSLVMYFAFYNDMLFHQKGNRSLIRSANNSVDQEPRHDIELLVVGVSDNNQANTVQTFLVRTTIGPFLSIDTWLVAVPASALDFYRQFQLHLQTTLDSNAAFNQLVHDARSVTLSPTPQAWADPNLVFYGGNPMCLLGTPQTFVQQTFGFYDICDRQLPLTVDLTPSSVLFAMAAMHFDVDVAVVCGLVAEPEVCHNAISALLGASRHLEVPTSREQLDRVVEDVRAAHPGIMQFSTDVDGANWTMLFQPLLDNSSFDIFSWTFVVDWIEGKREVVRFEGDAGSMALVSMPEVAVHFSSSTAYLTGATRTIFYIVVYMSLLIVVLAIGCGMASLSSTSTKRRHSNLMWFNQVVGSVWIGRPLLLLRGCTAVMLLSSTQLEPWSADGVRTRFATVPRSWCAIVVIAGEATWLSYVATDFLTIGTRRLTMLFAPLSYAVSWAVQIALEAYDPVYPIAWIDRKCEAQGLDQTLKCFSGVVQVGSFTRVWVVVLIQVACLVAAIVVAKLYETLRSQDESRQMFERHMLGVADNFYELDKSRTTKDCFAAHDTASWLMAGLVRIPFSKSAFLDVKLWLLTTPFSTESVVPFMALPTVRDLEVAKDQPFRLRPTFRRHVRRLWTVLGVLNAVGSILGSISYLQVSQVNLANDLMWATFNMSGAHAFTANWLNDQLVLGATAQVVRLDVGDVNDDKPYDQANGEVTSAPNVGGLLQYTELNTIEATIAGLRTTDACSVPWIFTQYCYVDFDQRWELANTEVRQERCKAMTANGAVFLESVLRNIDFAAFRHCWGHAFDVAIANELKLTVDGQTWLDMVSAKARTSVATEAAYWRNAGVRHFTTQWQNFKTIGLVNEYSISNVYGIAYPFSLETSYSAFRLERESTLKFYWAFANDLAAVSRNDSAVAGASLVRSSGSFAFANTSMESVLFERGTLVSPLAASFDLIEAILGPFGSVDMHHFPCPVVLKQGVQEIFTALRQSLSSNDIAQAAYLDIGDGTYLMNPVPKPWIDLNFKSVGGNILCPEVGASLVSHSMLGFTALSKQCFSIAMSATIPFVRKTTVAAAILSDLVSSTPAFQDATCSLVLHNPACPALLNSTIAFTKSFVQPLLGNTRMADMAVTATAAVSSLPIDLFQYGKLDDHSPLTIYRTPLLDLVDRSFAFYSWSILVQWAQGFREVVSFAGDVSSITLVTEYDLPQKQQVNRAQFPVNFAGYLRSAVWYITSTFLFIAVVLLVYFVLCRGHVEAMNLYKLQRVGAIVWVGRPFLFVRSITALGLLSTATLELRYSGFVTYFESVQLPLVKTCLAANEITWLAAVVNDLALVLTREYTSYYSTTNSFLVWAIMASISLALPMTHSMAIDKQCHLAQVDFQVVCTSGTLAIGRPTRFGILIAIVLVSNVVCYTITRRLVDKPQKTQLRSVFLYAGAKYMFTTTDWIDDDVYFMDRMSAAMNGILTVHVGSIMYALDVKLWCTFQVDLTDFKPPTRDAELALPLRLSSDY